MYKRKRAGNTITRKINSTKDTAAKADKNHYISNSYLEGFIPIDTEYFTASLALFLFLLMFDYFIFFLTILKALSLNFHVSYEQNADINAFLDAVLIASSKGI